MVARTWQRDACRFPPHAQRFGLRSAQPREKLCALRWGQERYSIGRFGIGKGTD
jgi:hypothetical protein